MKNARDNFFKVLHGCNLPTDIFEAITIAAKDWAIENYNEGVDMARGIWGPKDTNTISVEPASNKAA